MGILLYIFPDLFGQFFEIKLGIFYFPTFLNRAKNCFSSLHEKNAVLHHFKYLRKFYPQKKFAQYMQSSRRLSLISLCSNHPKLPHPSCHFFLLFLLTKIFVLP